MIDKTKIADLIGKATNAGSALEALQFSQAACNVANAANTANNINDQPGMSDAQIKHMAERFLTWKLPETFSPDNGISFDPVSNKGTAHERPREPVGTNLFTYTEAEAMIRHMLDEMPAL